MNISEVRAKFPQYNDMSDDQLAKAIHGKYYADMPYAEFASKVGLGAQTPQEAPGRGVGAEALRQGGLMVRNAAEGVMGLPGMVMDPINRLMGLKPLTEATSSLATRAGLPEAETSAEKLSAAGQKAAWGAGPLTLAAMTAKGGAAALPFVQQMAKRPMAEVFSSALGGTASEGARQAGGNEFVQMAAGMGAPMAASGALGVAKGGVTAYKELKRPLTRKGAEQIAADVLGQLATDKTKALSNLRQYAALKELERKTGQHLVGVPGVKPTAAAVAGDYGLVGGEQLAAMGPSKDLFARQFANNNAARLADIAKLKATDAQLGAYMVRRDQITGPLREAAFAGTKGPVNVDPVLDEVFRTFRQPEGQGAEAQKALNWLYGRIEEAKAKGAIFPQDMYEGLHKDINQLVSKGVDSENGRIRLAAGIATGIKNKLADAIEESAPGFKKYLRTYSRLSKPIDRLEVIKDKLGGAALSKVTTSLPMMADDGAAFALSQHGLRNAVRGIAEETPLAPRQSDILSRVLGDMNAATVASRGAKPPGSDTYQNIASANLFKRLLGEGFAESGVGKTVARPFNLAFRPLEARINDLIIEAYQDPEKMARLLEKARASRASPSVAGLLSAEAPYASGGLLGSLLAQ